MASNQRDLLLLGQARILFLIRQLFLESEMTSELRFLEMHCSENVGALGFSRSLACCLPLSPTIFDVDFLETIFYYDVD